uniref:CULT domain-containing protein n=1 Tax=Heterorhabditis bacteriophora TaxID=37862 RepID=A0A1I7XLC3_HETBA
MARYLLPIGILGFIINGEAVTRHVGELLCRECGASITRQSELLNVSTPEKNVKYKYEFPIVGKTAMVHVFENPAAETFHILTTKTAYLKFHGQASTDATWFPGMQWTVCVCSKCGQHMGWYFQPEKPNLLKSDQKSFVGLVLDYLISADCQTIQMGSMLHIVYIFLSSVLVLHALALVGEDEYPVISKRLSNDALIRLIMRNQHSSPFEIKRGMVKRGDAIDRRSIDDDFSNCFLSPVQCMLPGSRR